MEISALVPIQRTRTVTGHNNPFSNKCAHSSCGADKDAQLESSLHTKKGYTFIQAHKSFSASVKDAILNTSSHLKKKKKSSHRGL